MTGIPLAVLSSLLLLASFQYVSAQAIDTSAYVAGPRERASDQAARLRLNRQATALAANTFALAPTLASPGAPVLAPAAPLHINTTIAEQPLSQKHTSPAPLSAPTMHAATHNVTKIKPATRVPANRYKQAPPKSPPQAQKKAAARKAASRAPTPAPVRASKQAPALGPLAEGLPAAEALQPAAAPQEAVPAAASVSSTGAAPVPQAQTSVAPKTAAKGLAIMPSETAAAQLQPAASRTQEVQATQLPPAPVLASSFLQASAPAPEQAPAVASPAAQAPGPLVGNPAHETVPASLFESAGLAPAPAAVAALPPVMAPMEAPGLAPAPAPLSALTAAASPLEASSTAAFPPSDESSGSQQHHDILQVAVAQPAETALTPAASAPAPAVDLTAAAADALAATLRQAIGVAQASVVPNLVPRALPALLTQQASPSVQGPAPSSSVELKVPVLAEAPAVAAVGAPAALQGPKLPQQAAAAGPSETEPAASNTVFLADSGRQVISAGAPLIAGTLPAAAAPAPAPEAAALENGLAVHMAAAPVQPPSSGVSVLPPSHEELPRGYVAFLTTDVLQPEAASPDSVSLISVSLKSVAALTSQLYRAAPITSVEGTPAAAPVAALAAAAVAPDMQAPEASTAIKGTRAQALEVPVAPAPLATLLLAASQPLAYAPQAYAGHGVRPSAYGGYSANVNINAAQYAALPPQYSVQAGVSAAPQIQEPRPDHKGAQESRLAAAAPGSSGAAQVPSPGQRALEQLLSAASPKAQPASKDHFTSGYYDVWPAPAPCDGFFSVRARHPPLEAGTHYEHGGMPASRYGGETHEAPPSVGEALVNSAVPIASSAPAPAPGRSLTLEPLGAQTVLFPGPPSVPPVAAAEPSQAAFAYAPSPAAAYHAGFYAGIQAAQAALAVTPSASTPAEPAAASAHALAIAPTLAHAVASPPAPQSAEHVRPQSFAQAPQRGAYGMYGAYGAYTGRGVEARGSSFAHAPVVREYPLEGLPTPVAAPGPSRGEGKLAGSATGSYGTYGLGTYGYAAQQTSLASYARAPRDTAALGLAYSPVTQPAPPAYYAGLEAHPGVYTAFAVRPQAYYTPLLPRGNSDSTPAPAPAVFFAGVQATAAPITAPAVAAQTTSTTPLVPAPINAPALAPEAAISAAPTGQPALAPSSELAPAPSALISATILQYSSALAPAPVLAPEAATALALASSAPAHAPSLSADEISSAATPAPLLAPEAATTIPLASSAPAHAPSLSADEINSAATPAPLLAPEAATTIPLASSAPPALAPSLSAAEISPAAAPAPVLAPEPATTISLASSAPAHAPPLSAAEFAPSEALVAPSPAQAPQQPHTRATVHSSCDDCVAFGTDMPPSVAMSVSDGKELAQFSTPDGVPSNVVYFVADVAFSRPPISFSAQQISASNGTIIDVYPHDGCGRYVAKGYVEQPESGDPARTDIVLSINDGTVFDCAGVAFPGSSLTTSILNRPMGTLHTPSLKQSASGPVSNQSQVFLTLTFSQPVSSVSPADISVQLTQTQIPGAAAIASMPAPVAGGQNRRRLIEMPALAPAVGSCNAVHSLSMIQQTDGSPQAVFEFLLDISDCFLGLVGVDFVGTVHNSGGAENLPVSTLQFWQMSAAHLADFSIANPPMHQ